jgi:peptidyl-prolyl cis-trans isomerase B (cyclophilin B)
VASSKSRQRALARAKAERQVARRAAAARRRRQWQAGIGGALVLVLAVVGAIWAAGGFKPTPKKPDDCAWTALDTSVNTDAKDVGMPPTRDIPKSGSKYLQITTNQGVISAVLDLAKAPCTVASMSYLASKNFFDNTKCGRLVTAGTFLLQCGDPGTTGKGGPAYRFKTEWVPAAATPEPSTDPSASPSASPAPAANTYSRGMLAMYNEQSPDSNGSQFFVVYNDCPLPSSYTVFGTVVGGLDVVDKIAAGGTDGAFDQPDASGAPGIGGGHPKIETVIQTLTVTDTAPTAAPSGSTAPGAAPGTTQSASPSTLPSKS